MSVLELTGLFIQSLLQQIGCMMNEQVTLGWHTCKDSLRRMWKGEQNLFPLKQEFARVPVCGRGYAREADSSGRQPCCPAVL